MNGYALSLTQPWASLVVLGEKQWETRSWPTKYRGELYIHAAKWFPTWAKDMCDGFPCSGLLKKHRLTLDTLPRG